MLFFQIFNVKQFVFHSVAVLFLSRKWRNCCKVHWKQCPGSGNDCEDSGNEMCRWLEQRVFLVLRDLEWLNAALVLIPWCVHTAFLNSMRTGVMQLWSEDTSSLIQNLFWATIWEGTRTIPSHLLRLDSLFNSCSWMEEGTRKSHSFLCSDSFFSKNLYVNQNVTMIRGNSCYYSTNPMKKYV